MGIVSLIGCILLGLCLGGLIVAIAIFIYYVLTISFNDNIHENKGGGDEC